MKEYTSIKSNLQQSAAQLAAVSYFDNPAHIYMCPDERKRLRQLEWLLGLNLKMQLKYGAESFCYSEKGMVKAMGFWTQPNKIKINNGIKIREGLLKIPFVMGWSGFKRVLVASAGIQGHLDKTLGPNQPFRFLNYMVMEESRRCKGWGTKILEKQFEVIRSKDPNAVLALTTQRFRTVRFYERVGFEVLLEDKIGSGKNAFTNWTMRKILK